MTHIFTTFALLLAFGRKLRNYMFRIPTITKNLLIINLLMFLAEFVLKGQGINLGNLLGLHFFLSEDFHLYQLFTYMFMHANIQHILFNMFALWMFGCVVEDTWGPKKFLFYYITCGVGAGLMQMLFQFGQFYMMAVDQIPGFGMDDVLMVAHNNEMMLSQWTTVGASGAIYGILLAFGMLYPDNRIFIFPLPVPIKAKWFVIGYAAIELLLALGMPGDNVAHFAHLGGMLFGFLLIRYWRSNPGGGYGNQGGFGFFDKMKQNWERHSHRKADEWGDGRHRAESDWDYNARKKAEEDEIDRILDKVKRSGYDSLTEDEKSKLFNGGK